MTQTAQELQEEIEKEKTLLALKQELAALKNHTNPAPESTSFNTNGDAQKTPNPAPGSQSITKKQAAIELVNKNKLLEKILLGSIIALFLTAAIGTLNLYAALAVVGTGTIAASYFLYKQRGETKYLTEKYAL